MAKGRSLVTEKGWDLSEDEETPEKIEEFVNLCLMTSNNESTPTEIPTNNQEVSLNPSQNLNVVSCSSDNLDVYF